MPYAEIAPGVAKIIAGIKPFILCTPPLPKN
jgi:hypothetical protein